MTEEIEDTTTDTLEDSQRRDLDETRRLLLMALVADRTKRYNLAGSLINALLYHQKIDADRDQLIDQVVSAVNGEGDDTWIWQQIERVNAELEAS